MRTVIALLVLAATAAAGIARSNPTSYVLLDLPGEEVIVVVHPFAEGRVFLPGGEELGPCPVRVGYSSIDPWGYCFFEAPMLEADAIVIQPQASHDTLALPGDPIPLEGPVASDGWTTVDLAGMHGGGYTEGPVAMLAAVPGYGGCAWETLFALEIRSPDITGDLLVNLSDIVVFAQALGEYLPYADLWPDGTINLSDIVIMAEGIFAE